MCTHRLEAFILYFDWVTGTLCLWSGLLYTPPSSCHRGPLSLLWVAVQPVLSSGCHDDRRAVSGQGSEWGGHLLKPGHVTLRIPVALLSLRMTSYKNNSFCPPLVSGSKALSRNHYMDHSHNYRVIIINRSLQSQALWHNPVVVGLIIETIGDTSVPKGGQVLSSSLTASACHLPSSLREGGSFLSILVICPVAAQQSLKKWKDSKDTAAPFYRVVSTPGEQQTENAGQLFLK